MNERVVYHTGDWVPVSKAGIHIYDSQSFFGDGIFVMVRTFNQEYFILEKHIDRSSCEISVSTMWDSDGTEWPLYIEGKAIEMNKGDAVIYLGCEDEHWREVFTGDYHLQTFFHYVDQNGPFKDHKYDKIKFPHREYMKYNPEV